MTLSFLTLSFLGLCDFLASQFCSYISGTPLLTHLYGMLFQFLPLKCQYSHRLHPYPPHTLWVIFSISAVLNYLCFMTFRSISLGLSFGFIGSISFSVLYIYIYIYIYIYKFFFLAVLGLRCCSWAFSSCGERGLLSSCSARASDWVASLAGEHGL